MSVVAPVHLFVSVGTECPLPKTQVWCGARATFVVPGLTPTVSIRGTRLRPAPRCMCGDRRSLVLLAGDGVRSRTSPSPHHGGQLCERLSIAGSLKLLSQFTGSLLSTGCYPDECPQGPRWSQPPPPVPLSVTSLFATPQRPAPCAAVLRSQ